MQEKENVESLQKIYQIVAATQHSINGVKKETEKSSDSNTEDNKRKKIKENFPCINCKCKLENIVE